MSCRIGKPARFLGAVLGVGRVWPGPPAFAVAGVFSRTHTAVIHGELYAHLEFDNSLAGNETPDDCAVVESRAAAVVCHCKGEASCP